MQINWLQIGIAVVYMMVLVFVGLSMRSRIKNSADYWIGGRSLGPTATAISYCAAYYSTATVVGLPPLIYRYGMSFVAFQMFINVFLTAFIIFILFAPKMRSVSERVDAVSISGFLAVRYRSNKIRLICALVVAVMMIPYAMACVKGIADALTAIAGIPYVTGVIIITVVTFAYLVTSGLWGATMVDLIQGFTISIAVIFTAVAVVIASGGISPIFNYITTERPVHLEMPGAIGSWGMLFSTAGVWAFIAFGQPQLTTKFMGLKDSRTVGSVIRLSMVWQIVYFVSAYTIAAGALYLYKGVEFANIDLLAPSAATEFGGNLVAAVFLCGALAAGFSTVAALVLTASAAVAKDIYEDYLSNVKGRAADPNKSVKLSRVVTGVILILVGLGSLYPLDFVWFLSSMAAGVMGAALTAPVVFGLYWKRATTQGCVAAIIGGSLMSIYWYFAGLSGIVHSFMPGTILSFILMVVVSLMTQPLPKEHLDVFFEPGCSREKIDAAIASAK